MSLARTLAQLDSLAREGILALPRDGSFEEVSPDHPQMQLDNAPARAWRSKNFVVQLYDRQEEGALRLSVQRSLATEFIRNKDLTPISWNELMEVKAAAGFEDCWAVELYPPEDQVINDCPMRHLWILPGAPKMGWRKR